MKYESFELLGLNTVREIRELIGVASYYCRSMPNLSIIAAPLNEHNNEEICQIQMDLGMSDTVLKESLTVPLLAFPDMNTSYCLHRC